MRDSLCLDTVGLRSSPNHIFFFNLPFTLESKQCHLLERPTSPTSPCCAFFNKGDSLEAGDAKQLAVDTQGGGG